MPLPESLTTDQIAQLLTEKFCILREYICVDDFYPWLRSNNAFSQCDEEEIQNSPTRKMKAGALLDKIKLKGPAGFKAFTEVLEYNCQYSHVFKIVFDSEPRKPSKKWTETIRMPPTKLRNSSLRVYRNLLDIASSLTNKAVNYEDKVAELETLLEGLELEWEEKEKVLAKTIGDLEKNIESRKHELGVQTKEITAAKTENENLLKTISRLTAEKDSLTAECDKIIEKHRNEVSQTFPRKHPVPQSRKTILTDFSSRFDTSKREMRSDSDELKCLREKVELLKIDMEKINEELGNSEYENMQLRAHLHTCDTQFAKKVEQEQNLMAERNQALENVKKARIGENCSVKKYEEEKKRHEITKSVLQSDARKLRDDVNDLKQELQKRHHCCGASEGDVMCQDEAGRAVQWTACETTEVYQLDTLLEDSNPEETAFVK